MISEHELELSFYTELSSLDKKNKVFLVQDSRTDLVYVKKVLPRADLSVYEALSKAEIPGIPQIKAVIPDDDKTIIIEEHINGPNLADIMVDKLVTEPGAAAAVYKLCSTVEKLHSLEPPVIHRDIKPSNIIIAKDGTPYLIDFDAAKTYSPDKNRDTELIGTEGYAAPEQYGFSQSSPETDIYALGVLINDMVTGHLPVDGITEGVFKTVVEKATSMDPANRFHSAAELAEAIREASGIPEDVLLGRNRSRSEGSGQWAPHRARYLLPGFDSQSIVTRIMSLAGYALIVYSMLTADFVHDGEPLTGALLWMNRICAALSILGPIIYFGNFKGIKEKFPSRKSGRHNGLKTALAAFLLFLIPIMICALVERIMGI